MKLDEYIRELEACSEEVLLSREIADNYALFINADYNRFLKLLEESGKWGIAIPVCRVKGDFGNNMLHSVWSYNPGTVLLQTCNWINDNDTADMGYFEDRTLREHANRQRKDYNTTLSLHPYQERKMVNAGLKAMVFALRDLLQLFRDERIPFCLPCTGSSLRIIYYDPDAEALEK